MLFIGVLNAKNRENKASRTNNGIQTELATLNISDYIYYGLETPIRDTQSFETQMRALFCRGGMYAVS